MNRPKKGAFVVTSGEILFTALASFVMIHVTPQTHHRGSYYGVALVIQNIGRILGGAAAFPMIVHGSQPTSFIILSSLVIVGLTIIQGLSFYKSSRAIFVEHLSPT